ncbi:MAG: helix-turn-helix domain-containing protein [Pseudomonadota bacterium]
MRVNTVGSPRQVVVDAAGVRRKTAKVQTMVALAFNVSEEEMAAPTRSKAPIAFARQVAMYLCNVAMGLSLSQIAAAFSRDRTTVSHACHLIEDRRDEPDLDTRLAALEVILRAAFAEDPAPLHQDAPSAAGGAAVVAGAFR